MTQSELNKIKANLQSLNVEALSEIELLTSPTKFRCIKDGFEWTTEPQYILNGRSTCKHCKTSKIHENIEEELSYLNINVLSPYKNSTTKLQLQCAKESCQHTWLVSPTNLPSVKGCPECRKAAHEHNEKPPKPFTASPKYLASIETKEQFIAAATSLHGDKYSYGITNYYKGAKAISAICKYGKHKSPQFTIKTNKFLGGHTCPYCVRNSGGIDLALPATFYLIRTPMYVIFGTAVDFNTTYTKLEKLLNTNDIQVTGKKCYELSGAQAKKLEREINRHFTEYKVYNPSLGKRSATDPTRVPIWKDEKRIKLTALRDKYTQELVDKCNDFMAAKADVRESI